MDPLEGSAVILCVMTAYRSPNFQERAAAANQAKQRAIELLRNRSAPAQDVAEVRTTSRQAREVAEAERRSDHRARIDEEKAAKAHARAQARAEADAAVERAAAARRPAPAPSLPTAEEMKAARDARYAARKSRKR